MPLDLQQWDVKIMNSAGILMYYVMKMQPHAWTNLQLVIFETLPDVVSRHFKAY